MSAHALDDVEGAKSFVTIIKQQVICINFIVKKYSALYKCYFSVNKLSSFTRIDVVVVSANYTVRD